MLDNLELLFTKHCLQLKVIKLPNEKNTMTFNTIQAQSLLVASMSRKRKDKCVRAIWSGQILGSLYHIAELTHMNLCPE